MMLMQCTHMPLNRNNANALLLYKGAAFAAFSGQPLEAMLF